MGSKSIGELCTRICSGGTPKSGIAEYYEGGAIPWLNTREINFNRITRTEGFITEAGLAASSAKWIKPNAVIVAMYGATAGKCAIAKVPLTTNQACCNLEINDSIADYRYIYYWLMAHYSQVAGLANGGAQQNLNARQIRELRIDLPELSYQKKVSDLVSALDDAIDLNQRTNDYLESMIETMLSQLLAGETNKQVSLGDYLYIKGRIGWKGLKKSEYLPVSDYRIINGESLTISGINWEKAGFISKERYEESPEIMLEVGDILLSKDGTIGKIGYVDELEAPTSVASGIFVIRNTRQDELSTHFIYYLLRSHMFKAFVAGRTEGSVIPHLYQKDFVEFRFPLPDANTMKAFEDATRPMFDQVIGNTRENKMLGELRDALLPKLMSGEIDVSGVEIPTQPNNHLCGREVADDYAARQVL